MAAKQLYRSTLRIIAIPEPIKFYIPYLCINGGVLRFLSKHMMKRAAVHENVFQIKLVSP